MGALTLWERAGGCEFEHRILFCFRFLSQYKNNDNFFIVRLRIRCNPFPIK